MKSTILDKRNKNSGQSLQKRFERFVEAESLFDHKAKILLAVSGGVDSMVMLDLFVRAGFKIAVAHCNFGLRGEESDADETFVKQEVSKLGVDCYSKTFDTSNYASANKLSIQEAARDLRYGWFASLASEKEFDYIATAHNLNDSIETLLINLTRGTGLRGLAGIPFVNGTIVRPLLFSTRSEIEDYAKVKSIRFRTDSSNLQDCYLRNRIRQNIIPILEEANPSLFDNMWSFFGGVKEALGVVEKEVLNQRSSCTIETREGISIDIEKLLVCKAPRLVLFEILKDFGFNQSVFCNLFNSLKGQPGKVFFSKTHRAIKDRKKVFVEPIEKKQPGEIILIGEETKRVKVASQIFSLATKPFLIETTVPSDPNIAWLDKGKLRFPLKLRKILPGDTMAPLGMKGKKKISDILIDSKIPLHEKEEMLVFVSDNEIVWLAGWRISNKFKITTETTEVFEIVRTNMMNPKIMDNRKKKAGTI